MPIRATHHWAGLFLERFKAVPALWMSRLTSSMRVRCSTSPLSASCLELGILPFTIDNTLDDAFGQRIVSTMYTTLQQYHVILEVNPKFQYGPEALNGIYVKSSSGQQRRA